MNGITSYGATLSVRNTLVGLAVDGMTPAPNNAAGIYIAFSATNTTIGAPGSIVIVSGNAQVGIIGTGTGVRVLSTLVGVAANGITTVPNGAEGIYFSPQCKNCTVGVVPAWWPLASPSATMVVVSVRAL